MTRTGYIRQVEPNPRHPLRTDVWLNDGWPVRLYTMEPEEKRYLATLCRKAKELCRAVTVETRSGGVFGEEIVKVDLHPANAQEGSAA